jgi:hypothetical protein
MMDDRTNCQVKSVNFRELGWTKDKTEAECARVCVILVCQKVRLGFLNVPSGIALRMHTVCTFRKRSVFYSVHSASALV